MDIQDLGAIGEFLSSIVVIATLIALTYQLREGKRATQQANLYNYRNLVAQSINPAVEPIVARANQNLMTDRESLLAPYIERWGVSYEDANQVISFMANNLFNIQYLMQLELPEEDVVPLLKKGLIPFQNRPVYKEAFEFLVQLGSVPSALLQEVEARIAAFDQLGAGIE